VITADCQADISEAIREIPSPTRSRARAAKAKQRAKTAQEGAVKASQSSVAAGAFEVDLADLQVGECIGAGTTAEVYKASWHGTDVAVKTLRGPLPSEFQRELAVLSQFRHPHLVLFMGVSTAAGHPKIISELCEGGTLFRLLHQQKEVPLSWPQRLKIATDTAKGMNFLHRQQVVHRDLKSLNLLLAAKVDEHSVSPFVKVSDFGLSRFLPLAPSGPCGACSATMTGGVGTALWMAPEVLSGSSYTEKVDVYSFAIVLYELLTRWIPFDGSGLEPVSIAVAVTTGRRPDTRYVPMDCPASLCRTMRACWAHGPMQRPTFDIVIEMLKHMHCL
jgi:serine/threonine protein kinase